MPFTFAWVGPDETTFGAEHEVEDEQILRIEVAQVEGLFATLRLLVQNPRVGLLNEGRELWAWLGYHDDSTDGVTPLFFGRIVGIPQGLDEETVWLEFIARPDDYDARKSEAANALMEMPEWDPVFLPEERRDDPDTALEARPARWHIDRITHAVTASDILNGEDGTLLVEGNFFRDSLQVTYGQPPVRRVEMLADVYWNQQAAGRVDLTKVLLKASEEAGSRSGQYIETFTGDGLAREWPTKGTRIGSGWSVGPSHVIRGDGIWIPEDFEAIITADQWGIEFPVWRFQPVFKVDYDVSRSRQERVSFVLEADCQAVLTEPGDEEVIRLALASRFVGEPIDPPYNSDGEGEIPIGDVRRRAYFTTDRGKQSLEYLIRLARAHLLFRSRTVEVAFEMPFEDALAISCRKNVYLADERLPGGECVGKVLSYTIFVDGEGAKGAAVVIGCAVGQGDTIDAEAGTQDYIADDYIEAGYYAAAGLVIPIPGEVTYESIDGVEPNDDGIDFFNMTPARIIDSSGTDFDGLEMINGYSAQKSIINAFTEGWWPDVDGAIEALNEVYTQIRLKLVPLTGGPFLTEYPVDVSELMVPKHIDLEASSGTA